MPDVAELYQAIDANDVARAKALLASQSDLADAVALTPPPIHWAIYQNKPQMVELLLDHGADIERQDQDRSATPLDYAIVYGRKAIVSLLIERGANPEGRLQLALKGASGGFEAYSELPPRQVYAEIVQLLRTLGVADGA